MLICEEETFYYNQITDIYAKMCLNAELTTSSECHAIFTESQMHRCVV